MLKEEKKLKRARFSCKMCFFVFSVIVIILIGTGLWAVNWYNNAIFTPSQSASDNTEIVIQDGENLNTIARELQDKNLIQSEIALKIYARLNNLTPSIKAGTYSIAKGNNVPELIDILERGVFKKAVGITIKEGLTDSEIANVLDTEFLKMGVDNHFSKTDFMNMVNSPDDYQFDPAVQSFLNLYKPVGKPLTGFLFPDTYKFDFDSDAQVVVQILVVTLQRRLDENNINPADPNPNQNELKNFYDALTLASIIEKESGNDATQKSTISGVFHNRLSANHPLESDATVNYITGKHDASPLISDTQIASAYNTYQNVGLPPTPINNPGIESIKASIYPVQTDYFYFLHDAQGNVFYAKTFAEHQENVNNHLNQ